MATKKKTKKKPARRASSKKAKPTRKHAPRSSRPKKVEAAPADADGWPFVNRLQLAQLIGVHRDTISHYTRDGMPVEKRGGQGKGESVYDAVACLKWWRSNQGLNAKEAAQTRAYDTRAKLNELQFKIKTGELIPRDDVIAAGQAYTKAWRAKVRALPRQLIQTGIVPREKEPLVGALLDGVLTEISRWKEIPE